MVNCSYNAEHPWISMSNEEVLRSGQMIAVDPETGKEGLTLAAILLFGKRNTIASVLPMYFIDVLCRIHDTELYDDRLQVKENLMVAYRSIMEFIKNESADCQRVLADGNCRGIG